MTAIQSAIKTFPSQKAFAEAVGVSPSFVSQWVSGTRRVPPGLCRKIEALVDGAVKAEELRPDIFGEAA